MPLAKIEFETALGDSVANVTSTLVPSLVFVGPRACPGLYKSRANLPCMLRYAAVVNTAMGGTVVLHSAVIGASVSLWGVRGLQ